MALLGAALLFSAVKLIPNRAARFTAFTLLWQDSIPKDVPSEILSLNQTILESVLRGDWDTYAELCSEELSCFEAETNGILAEGLPFHRYYFELAAQQGSDLSLAQVSMARPHLRWLADDAVILSYTRLTQRLQNGEPITSSCCETRVWQCLNGHWKQVHVHRS
jgi:calcium/calmodulin-dependent protein kinase (CaM kinase) II